MKPVRVMRLIARLNMGGPARHVVWLTARLDKRFETRLLAGHVESNEPEMTVMCRTEHVTPVYVKGLGRSIGFLKEFAAFFEILHAMEEFRPDIVHTHTSKAGLLGRAAAWILNHLGERRKNPIKIVHTFHGHVLHSYFSWPVTMAFRLIEKILGNLATDRILVIAPQQFDELAGRYRVAPRGKFRLLPIAIDLEPFAAAVRRPAPNDTIRVGLVGRLTAIKNPHLFLRAGRIAMEEEPRIRLVVVGDGELLAPMKEWAPEGTEFTGSRDDIAEVMAGLDILVISSDNEGTPVSILEAFASGVAVAATKAGGVVNLLADGRGLLSEIGNADALACNIISLARDPELRNSCAEKGLAYVRERHSLPRLVSDMEKLYDELLAERSPS